MPDEPLRYGNADEAALDETERRQIVHTTLALARAYLDYWARWPTTQEVEEHMDGKRSL